MKDFNSYWEARHKFYSSRSPDDQRDYYKSLFAEVVPYLRKEGITMAECDFYGSGDSGDYSSFILGKGPGPHTYSSTKDVTCMVPRDLFVKKRRVVYNEDTQTCSYEWDNVIGYQTWTEKPEEEQPDSVSVDHILERALDCVLDDTNIDWYNNEGGGGTFRLNIEDDDFSIFLRVYQNEYTQHTCLVLGKEKTE